MAEVVALRPSIAEAAHNVAIKFAKADTARDKARSLRVEIGLDLIDLQRRVADGEARKAGEPEEFWVWIKLRVNRSLQDMRKCIALAKADDPEAAAAQEREDTRERMQQHRQRAHSARPAQVVNIDPVERAIDMVRSLTEDERKRFLARLEEEYPWLSGGAQRSK